MLILCAEREQLPTESFHFEMEVHLSFVHLIVRHRKRSVTAGTSDWSVRSPRLGVLLRPILKAPFRRSSIRRVGQETC